MEDQTYLNSDNYKKDKNIFSIIALIILISALILGASYIVREVVSNRKVEPNYLVETKESIEEEINLEIENLKNTKEELETKRTESLNIEREKLLSKKIKLIAKGVEYDSSTKSEDGESYDLKLITNALNPSLDNCAFDEYKNNDITSAYCLLYNKKDDYSKNISIINSTLDSSFNNCSFDYVKNNSYTSKYCYLKDKMVDKVEEEEKVESKDTKPSIAPGIIIIIVGCILSGGIYMFGKKNEAKELQAKKMAQVSQNNNNIVSNTTSNENNSNQ